MLIFDTSENLDAILVETEQNTTVAIIESKTQKYLGLMLDYRLKFTDHIIEYIKKKSLEEDWSYVQIQKITTP